MKNNETVAQEYETGIRLTIKVRPASRHDLLPCVVDIGDGKRAIELTVHAPAQEGKANKAVKDEVARLMGVKKKDVSIKTGHKSRIKAVEIAGIPSLLREQLFKLNIEM